MAPLEGCVFATLLLSDGYLPGAMVLGHSLRDRGAQGKLVVFVVIEKLAEETIRDLKTIYDEVIPVPQITNYKPANLYLMNRPDLHSTFTKIELWRQTQYRRIVYLDADMVAIRCPNELLTLNTEFAAAPDVGWPDCFNSGMMVLNPNMGDYYALQAMARRGISFDGADQGLLNMHFNNWERLSFAYNCTPNANYQYVPAYRHFQSTISMVHFIGAEKPWTMGRDNKHNEGVYGELLGRWWTVYDRHFRQPKVESYRGKVVQDYVRGEETIYTSVPSQTAPPGQNEAQPDPPPGIHITAPAEDSAATMERPFGDQPDMGEMIDQQDFKPTSTVEQRRWSAPHAEWEPTRQPPPVGAKPEAINFPTQVYEMSDSKALFEPPASYPSPPKDMWYQVPEKPAPAPKPKQIFPWEKNQRKATRVFPRSRDPSPPPPPAPSRMLPADEPSPPSGQADAAAITSALAEVAKDPTPPKHIFPWEARAPKPTRVFPSQTPPEATRTPEHVKTPSFGTDITDATAESVPAPQTPETTWESFQQRGNAWDDIPEITRYMEAVSRPRRAKIQVLHHTPSAPTGDTIEPTSPPAAGGRRPSLKLTDFPTEIERPSLPVTPAPIRRPTFWSTERDEHGDLPPAVGVPKQDEWVRRFLSYPSPAFFASRLYEIDGIVHLKCQRCGEQNPIARLEELQRRQSEIMLGQNPLEGSKTPPRRDMPESGSKDAAIEAALKAMEPKPKAPAKPILKEPSFELEPDADTETLESITPTLKEPLSDSQPRFSPIVLEGEAASESKIVTEELISPTSVA